MNVILLGKDSTLREAHCLLLTTILSVNTHSNCLRDFPFRSLLREPFLALKTISYIDISFSLGEVVIHFGGESCEAHYEFAEKLLQRMGLQISQKDSKVLECYSLLQKGKSYCLIVVLLLFEDLRLPMVKKEQQHDIVETISVATKKTFPNVNRFRFE